MWWEKTNLKKGMGTSGAKIYRTTPGIIVPLNINIYCIVQYGPVAI